MNVECDPEIIEEIHNAFRFNDAVIRNLITQCKKAITEPSPLMKAKDERDSGRDDDDDDMMDDDDDMNDEEDNAA
jgi:small subunit ribosomal protein S6